MLDRKSDQAVVFNLLDNEILRVGFSRTNKNCEKIIFFWQNIKFIGTLSRFFAVLWNKGLQQNLDNPLD